MYITDFNQQGLGALNTGLGLGRSIMDAKERERQVAMQEQQMQQQASMQPLKTRLLESQIAGAELSNQQQQGEINAQERMKANTELLTAINLPFESRQRFLKDTASTYQDPATKRMFDELINMDDDRQTQTLVNMAEVAFGGSKKGQAMSDPAKKTKELESLEIKLTNAIDSGDKKRIESARRKLESFRKFSGIDAPSAEDKADISAKRAANVELSKMAAKASGEAFDSLKNVRTSINNMTDAIAAIDNGASTGPIESMLPSFRQSTIELENIANKMGLDIVGATTFGALSESELEFALSTAMPRKMKPKELKEWLIEKRAAQEKLAGELRKAAIFLGTPGNTIAKYLEENDILKYEKPESTGFKIISIGDQ